MAKGTPDLFRKIVLEGLLSTAGMASFANSLEKNEVEALHQFLIKQQQIVYSEETNK